MGESIGRRRKASPGEIQIRRGEHDERIDILSGLRCLHEPVVHPHRVIGAVRRRVRAGQPQRGALVGRIGSQGRFQLTGRAFDLALPKQDFAKVDARLGRDRRGAADVAQGAQPFELDLRDRAVAGGRLVREPVESVGGDVRHAPASRHRGHHPAGHVGGHRQAGAREDGRRNVERRDVA